MAFRKSKSSAGLRLAVLFGLAVALRHWGLSFSVKGLWEGEMGDVKTLPKGLAPTTVSGIVVDTGKGVSVHKCANCGIHVNYTDGPLTAIVHDNSNWEANYTVGEDSFRASGKGADDIRWAATKQGTVAGLGDVEVNVNSEEGFTVSVDRALPSLQGVDLKASASSHGDAIKARLEAARTFAKDVDVMYTVENNEGDYNLANLVHNAEVNAAIAGAQAIVQLGKDSEGPKYNVTLTRKLSDLLKATKTDSEVTVGADNEGFYGELSADQSLGKGIDASYKVAARSGGDSNATYSQSATLSHKFATLEMSQDKGKPIALVAKSDVTTQGHRIQGEVGYTVKGKAPTYNLTFSPDLGAIVDSSKAVDSAAFMFGLDDASADGVYAELSASRSLGNGFGLELSSSGRAKNLEHSVKLSNDLGYAEVVKSGRSDPRLRLGYEFDV